MTWNEIIQIARQNLESKETTQIYAARLDFEISEIEKQSTTTLWEQYYNENKKFDKNPNSLLLPWLLNMLVGPANVDPITNRKHPMLNTIRSSKVSEYISQYGDMPSDFAKDPDMPDIDLDCLPEARDPIKKYAIEKYGNGIDDGYGAVCSVGTWQTYKFKSAIIDVFSTLGYDKNIAYDLTTNLPKEVDELRENGKSACKGKIRLETGEEKECGFSHAMTKCPKCSSEDTDGPTIGKLLNEHVDLYAFCKKYPDVIKYAIRLIGRIRNMGMHAGALIITDRSLYGNVPLAKSSGEHSYWISMWSEGRNSQLSKYGYIKWDILGLKTLKYIFTACQFIEQNRGISFGVNASGWDDIDPELNRAGHFFDVHGNKHYISLNDEYAIKLANELKTDGIFQFDTELAKRILANGSRNFNDLMLFNAMGHPGPMQSIPEAVENRDDVTCSWKNKLNSKIYEVLKDTYGVIVYQEQLQAIWQNVAGFTAPDAQEARKAVAKKHTHKLKPIRQKWLEGASSELEQSEAEMWWTKMETFGRYAFNKCLGKDTILQDNTTKQQKTVEQWYNSKQQFDMLSYKDGKVVVDKCVRIHKNQPQEVFEITFDNGHTEMVTMQHKLLCQDGQYHEVREIIEKGLDVTRIDAV